MTTDALKAQLRKDRLTKAKSELQLVLDSCSQEDARYLHIALNAVEAVLIHAEGELKRLNLDARESASVKLLSHAEQLNW